MATDVHESHRSLPPRRGLSEAIFLAASRELSRICRDSATVADLAVIVRQDPFREQGKYFLDGKTYTMEQRAELSKPTVDVYVPRGHGVLFPDGLWMTAIIPVNQFTCHMDYGMQLHALPQDGV